jgi:Zn-dependent peptidase ImmA (M78 family)
MSTDFNFSYRLKPEELQTLEEFTSEIPVRIGALAKALGLEVVVATLPLSISGMVKPENGKYVIKVNRFEPKERQRFTIAHEIAHYLLHRDLIAKGVVDSTLYRSKLSSRLEAEANKLAADILMPRRIVARELTLVPEYVDDVDAYLAEKFRVSKPAMDIRTG